MHGVPQFPKEPRRGDDMNATWGASVCRALRALTLLSSPGVRITRTPNGTTMGFDPAQPGGGGGGDAHSIYGHEFTTAGALPTAAELTAALEEFYDAEAETPMSPAEGDIVNLFTLEGAGADVPVLRYRAWITAANPGVDDITAISFTVGVEEAAVTWYAMLERTAAPGVYTAEFELDVSAVVPTPTNLATAIEDRYAELEIDDRFPDEGDIISLQLDVSSVLKTKFRARLTAEDPGDTDTLWSLELEIHGKTWYAMVHQTGLY